MPPRSQLSLLERILDKVEMVPWTGCWVFVGALNASGYGHIMGPGREVKRVHRVVYEQLVGPIPDGLHLDHLCRVRPCCNPAHLEPVTNHENHLRGIRRTRAVCPNGHALTEETIYWELVGKPQRRRLCRLCLRVRRHRYYLAWKERRCPTT